MAKIDEMIAKYDTLDKRTIRSYNNTDPTKTKKYLEYKCKLKVKEPHLETRRINDSVNLFNELLPYIKNKDIYSSEYDSYNKLITVLSKAKQDKEKKELEKVTSDECDILVENDKFLLLSPKTHRASRKYGASTRWCTAAKENYQFNSYTRSGYLIYLIRKKERANDNWNKVAFYVKKDQLFSNIDIYSANDNHYHGGQFLSSSWSYYDAMSIITHINVYVSSYAVVDKAKDKFNKFKKTVETLDVNDIIEYAQLGGDVEQGVKDLVSSLNEINKTLNTLKKTE
jgi:hypothetical protein